MWDVPFALSYIICIIPFALFVVARPDGTGYVYDMATIAIPAHFDGKQIVLDEPYNLPTNANLLVTLLPDSGADMREDVWLKAVAKSDAFAFLADPAEDIYTITDGDSFSPGE